jgi:hypothetical protein
VAVMVGVGVLVISTVVPVPQALNVAMSARMPPARSRVRQERRVIRKHLSLPRPPSHERREQRGGEDGRLQAIHGLAATQNTISVCL